MARATLGIRTSLCLRVGAIVLLAQLITAADSSDDPYLKSRANITKDCYGSYECASGIILPIWVPNNPSVGDKVARAIVYFVALIYMFLGVSIIADRFMASIEVITSQEKEITIKRPDGETTTTTVRVWNETVSNLTLMALGSSAPEILLSIIEICGHGFEAGELGPSTIVGSAAFNMFVIIAICVYSIPDGETRKIKHLRVFFVTAAWSIFAYIWLYLILAVISPNVVDIWEALLTFMFFPICVVFAWVADRRLLFYKYMYKKYRADKHRGIIIETEGDRPRMNIEMDGRMLNYETDVMPDGMLVDGDEKDIDESRRDMIKLLKELKQKYPEKDLDQLVELANYQALTQQQKSRAFYRIQAIRMMTGAGNILKKHAADQARKAMSVQNIESDGESDFVSKICFEPGAYQCFENCGSCILTVSRKGGDTSGFVSVRYKTENGTATAGSDFEFSEGKIVFKPGETQKEISISIIDDDIFEEDEHFYVRLSDVEAEVTEDGPEINHVTLPKALLVEPTVATVTIFDDDHAGIFMFEEKVMRVSESVGVMEAKVMRTSGARGTVVVPYRTMEGTAHGSGDDYEDSFGELEFHNDEIVKTIDIKVIDDEEYEKNKTFCVELGEPRLVEIILSPGGVPPPGVDVTKTIQVHINNDGEYEKQENFFIALDHPRWMKTPDKHENGLQAEMDKEEAQRIAEMGRPILGENSRLEVIIEESYEFKSTVDKLIKKTNLALVVGTNSWKEQFKDAITVSAGDDDDDEETGEEKLPSCFDYVMHFLTVFWKVLFAFVPPTDVWNGWACFLVSISVIGLLTAMIGDLASHFGCTVGLKDSVTAVVFVALGTSIPDTFASKVAAVQDQFADASVGNVTGSNAVNVFLGIGIAWTIASVHCWANNKKFYVDPGTLAFSVTLFTVFAFICVGVLMWRRRPSVGGELGGPRNMKLMTTGFFILLWLIYILFAGLEAYCHVKAF